MVMASPSCAIEASLFASSRVSFALVATTPMVVLPKAACPRAAESMQGVSLPSIFAAATSSPVAGSYMSPSAFTTAIAPTFTPFSSSIQAVPRPLFTAYLLPKAFATVAPVPAPMLPDEVEALASLHAA